MLNEINRITKMLFASFLPHTLVEEDDFTTQGGPGGGSGFGTGAAFNPDYDPADPTTPTMLPGELDWLGIKAKMTQGEDAVNQWIGGISWGAKMTAPAYEWFKSHSPIHFKEFQKNPVAYYKKHRKEIEAASGYAGGSSWLERQDNTDLFANIPFNLDEG